MIVVTLPLYCARSELDPQLDLPLQSELSWNLIASCLLII